jgi:hypothetical protein
MKEVVPFLAAKNAEVHAYDVRADAVGYGTRERPPRLH